MKDQIENWHRFVETEDAALLEEILADEVRFHSPFVWKPKEGKMMTTAILTTVIEVFEEFKYIREIRDDQNCMLEFEAKIGDLTMHGVDIIKFGKDGKFVDFEVMVRPANALQVLGMKMTERLTEKGFIGGKNQNSK
jgi:hypothetical protein